MKIKLVYIVIVYEKSVRYVSSDAMYLIDIEIATGTSFTQESLLTVKGIIIYHDDNYSPEAVELMDI